MFCCDTSTNLKPIKDWTIRHWGHFYSWTSETLVYLQSRVTHLTVVGFVNQSVLLLGEKLKHNSWDSSTWNKLVFWCQCSPCLPLNSQELLQHFERTLARHSGWLWANVLYEPHEGKIRNYLFPLKLSGHLWFENSKSYYYQNYWDLGEFEKVFWIVSI